MHNPLRFYAHCKSNPVPKTGLRCCEPVVRRGKSLGQQLRELFAEVGSFYPPCENFRLTPEVKEKFTEKLRLDAECRR